MKRIVVMTFDDEFRADEARVALRRMEAAGALEIHNTAVVVRPPGKPLRMSLDLNQTADGLRKGQLMGILLAGLFHFMPLIPVGTAVGALIGRCLRSLDPAFLKRTGSELPEGHSALVLLGSHADHLRVAEFLLQFRPHVSYSEVPEEVQAQVREHLAGLTQE